MNFIKEYNKTAIIYDGKEISYRDVIRNAKCFSETIQMNPGDRGIIYMENRPEFLYSFLGIWEKEQLQFV